jgi:RNA polymerase sigma-70 factor (ECF subfamily)
MSAPLPRSDGRDEERERQALLAQLRTGDEGAFEQLFRMYAAALCDFAFSYVRSKEIAEEVVQDLFCWIWEQRFTVEMPHGVRAWLFTAVRNRALNALRNIRSEIALDERLAREMPARGAVVQPDAVLAARELSAAVAEIVAVMSPRCREAFVLIREQGMSYAEAAHVMGISAKTVEIHMTRAMTTLRMGLAGLIVD